MNPVRLVHNGWATVKCVMYIFLRQCHHHVRPQTLKQHVAKIDVRGLFDLKKDHAVFALGVSWYN